MALFITCPQHSDKFRNSSKLIHISLLLLMTHERGQSPWLVSSFYPTLMFIQYVSSTMCDVSTSKIKQTRQPSTWTTKNLFCFVFSQPSITNKTALTFMPHKSHIWLTSKFCFLFIHQKLVLSADQYIQRFFSFKYLAVYVNAFISDPEITENLSCSFFF